MTDQGGALHPDQQAADDRVARAAELWRWLLTQRLGRAFLYEVVFAELGYLRHIRTGAVEALYEDVALHNLSCRWMAQVGRHRDLSMQMFAEASKREDEERARYDARRRDWDRRSQIDG